MFFSIDIFHFPTAVGTEGHLLPKETTFLSYIFVFSNLFVTFALESDKQRATVSAPAVTVSVALPADIKKPPIETGAGTFYGGNL